MELKDIKGLGSKRIAELNENKIFSVEDLLNYLPYKYYDFSKIVGFSKNISQNSLIKASVILEAKAVFFKGKSYTICKMQDVTNCIEFNAVWYNQPYMKNNLEINKTYYLYGQVNNKSQFVVLKSFAQTSAISSIMPIYKSFETISSGLIRNCINQILSNNFCANSYISEQVETKFGIMDISKAYNILHGYINNFEQMEEAKYRLSVEKMLPFAALEDEIKKTAIAKEFRYNSVSVEDFERLLPYHLTKGQRTAILDIYADMDSAKSMNRLVLGDVGSGKTVVAFGAIYKALKSNMQSILLCPTEILAMQHYNNALSVFNSEDVALLTSSTTRQESEIITSKIRDGNIKILISTHSCLNDNIIFNNLSLVITDEQHRFGVSQRAKLTSKRQGVDTIIMSATPIPRSLSLVLFGGLEVSKLDERPMGESKIKTNILSENKVADMWQYIYNNLNETNGKVFVVVPRIKSSTDDENGKIASIADVVSEINNYNLFKNDEIETICGNMIEADKQKAINNFKFGKAKVLVATTVVEVGVDIKEANIMVIYNAERFGLATLHQLRGRVGRDGNNGYCFCIAYNSNETIVKRLNVFKNNNDGLKIAEEDLKIRGAGSYYGTNQHGVNELYLDTEFSTGGYLLAKQIFAEISDKSKNSLKENAKLKYGEMFKQIVFN